MNLKLCLKVCILSVFIITSCNSRKKSNINCDEYFERAQEYLNEYYFNETPELLDSAMVYLSLVEEKCNYEPAAIDLQKAHIYFLKNDFKKAISIFEKYDEYDKYVLSFPRDVLINKIKAVEARTNGDERMEKEYYSYI